MRRTYGVQTFKKQSRRWVGNIFTLVITIINLLQRETL